MGILGFLGFGMTDAFVKGWRPHVMLVWLLDFSSNKGNVYDILWALVFGFATLNILSLVVRRSDSGRSRLSMGEILAIMVVCVSVLLLGWELLNIFKIFPIKLQPR